MARRGDDVRFGLWYDFRNPPRWERPAAELYAQILDQIAWAEELGCGSVWLTEHHFTEDGYTPSPLVLAGAIAARTTRLRIGMSLMLLPLHDPVRMAEDAATLGILSQGRFDMGFGIGYRELEFDAFDRSLSHRPSLMEEGIDVIRRGLAGESIAIDGRRFSYPDVKLSPVPALEHRPRLLLGGMSEPAIDRCARLGDGFLSTQNVHQPMYLEALARHGKDREQASIHAGQWAIVDADPERTWAQIGDHAVYQLNEYIGWGAFGPPDEIPRFEDRDAVVAGGGYQLLDGPAAIAQLTELLRDCPQIEDVYFWAQLPGEPLESGARRMEFLMNEVAPQVRAGLREEAAA